MTIGPFRDEYRWLSNFWLAEVTVDGVTYKTAEHYYQSAKCAESDDYDAVVATETPGQAKRLGSTVTPRADWDEYRVTAMNTITLNKFRQHPELAQKLLETELEAIVEFNSWHDNFWGQCTCDDCTDIVGLNTLGTIIMNVRARLQQ